MAERTKILLQKIPEANFQLLMHLMILLRQVDSVRVFKWFMFSKELNKI